MLILAKRIIDVLKANTDLVNYIGGNTKIFPENSCNKTDKYIVVGTEVGEDGNSLPVDRGDIFVEAVVRRDVANAPSVCLELSKKIDAILNKGESTLTDTIYKILHFVRVSSSGLEVDENLNEYYYRLNYNYILSEV